MLLVVQFAYPNIWLVVLFMTLTVVVLQCGDGECIEAASAVVDLLAKAWEKHGPIVALLWGRIEEWLFMEVD